MERQSAIMCMSWGVDAPVRPPCACGGVGGGGGGKGLRQSGEAGQLSYL